MASSTPDTTAPVAPYLLASASFKYVTSPQVTFSTSLGSVVFELNPTKAPITVANMLDYVNDGFYTGTLFHRVISGFVVQGGGFTTGLVYKTPTYDPITLESNNGLSNLRGTLAMARTSVADSATSQFYVNLVDNTGLDYASASSPGYAVFGEVITGMSVIDSIATQPVTSASVPQTEILINSATESEAGTALSKTGVISVGALETGAKWEYSINGGSTWIRGKGTSFTLSEGTYTNHSITVRQTDQAGNVSEQIGKSVGTLTVDKTAPTVASFSPANGLKGVGVTDNIVITFNESVQLGTGTIVLKTSSGTVIETYNITPGTSSSISLTIDPTADFSYATSYKLEVSAGSITDVAGNSYKGTRTYKFSTTDTVSTTATTYTLGTEANKLVYAGTDNFTGNGNAAKNVITGGSGNDTLYGALGNDTISGGDGNDNLLGDSETPTTADGKDSISGGNGDDNIWGCGGSDAIDGSAGNDILYGQDGSDTVTGGGGNDYFVLSKETNTGIDVFMDFTPDEDKIAFIKSNFSGLPATLTAADFLAGAGKTKPTDGQHLVYNTSSGELYYDADGLATTAAIKVAIAGKASHPTLSFSDFLMG